MECHDDPSPTEARHRSRPFSTPDSRQLGTNRIDELASNKPRSHSHPEITTLKEPPGEKVMEWVEEEPSVDKAMKWIEEHASITIESTTDAEGRLQRDTQDRERDEEEFNGNAALLLNLIEVQNLSKTQQNDARTKVQEMVNAFANLLRHVEDTQTKEFEQRRDLMLGVAAAYAAARKKKSPWTDQGLPKAQTEAPEPKQNQDQAEENPEGRHGSNTPLKIDPEGSRAHSALNELLSDGMTRSARAGKLGGSPRAGHGEEGETQRGHGHGHVGLKSLPTSGNNAHIPGGEFAGTAMASGTTNVSHKDKENVHLQTRRQLTRNAKTGHSKPDSHATQCFDETCGEHLHQPRARGKQREGGCVQDGHQSTVYFPGTPRFFSWRNQGRFVLMPDARDAPANVLLDDSTLDGPTTPEDVKAILAASSASSASSQTVSERSPRNVVGGVDEEHYVQGDGAYLTLPASSAGSARNRPSTVDSGIISDPMGQSSPGNQVQSPNGSQVQSPPGSQVQSPDGSPAGRRKKRSSLFRESFLVEKVDPSWSPPFSGDPEEPDAGGWLSVSMVLFYATSRFFIDQALPWLHVICFLGTLAYACLFSGVEFIFAPIQAACLRFEKDIANPLPVPVVSEVPERSRLVIATHLMTTLGLLALITAYRLERLRESWMEANGMTRVLFVDYLRGVGRRSWRDIAPMLLRGFEVHQTNVIGKLYA